MTLQGQGKHFELVVSQSIDVLKKHYFLVFSSEHGLEILERRDNSTYEISIGEFLIKLVDE
jgi:hypothetical protein